MATHDDFTCVCSVSELARKLDLSRTRFYQLMAKGVFPRPAHCPRTGRPFYPLKEQNECMRIRKTGIGHNGQPFLFYGRRKDKAAGAKESLNQELVEILKRMGLHVTKKQVATAIRILRPGGLERHAIEGTIVRDLFGYFKEGP